MFGPGADMKEREDGTSSGLLIHLIFLSDQPQMRNPTTFQINYNNSQNYDGWATTCWDSPYKYRQPLVHVQLIQKLRHFGSALNTQDEEEHHNYNPQSDERCKPTCPPVMINGTNTVLSVSMDPIKDTQSQFNDQPRTLIPCIYNVQIWRPCTSQRWHDLLPLQYLIITTYGVD